MGIGDQSLSGPSPRVGVLPGNSQSYTQSQLVCFCFFFCVCGYQESNSGLCCLAISLVSSHWCVSCVCL